MIEWLAALPFFMVFNRIRGGGMPELTDPLFSRALFWVATCLGLLTMSIVSWQAGLALGFWFAIWGMMGWGIWFDPSNPKDNSDDPRQDDLFVKFINKISFNNKYVALFFRMFIFVVPYFVTLSFIVVNWYFVLLSLVSSLLMVGAYHLKKYDGYNNMHSELLVGAIWWASVLPFLF